MAKNPLHSHRFYQQLKYQPIEFFWQAEDGISLVAVLRVGPTEHVIHGLHTSLFRAEKRIDLMLFGKGNIDSSWLELFAREQKNLSARTGFEFILSGVVDSQRSLLSYDGLDAGRALAFFNDEATLTEPADLFLWMRAHPYDDLVVLDVPPARPLRISIWILPATASTSSAPISWRVRDAFAKAGRHWLYNATVGAGLPVNHTVRDLLDSGDSILRVMLISGVWGFGDGGVSC